MNAVKVCEEQSQNFEDSFRVYTSYERHDHVEYSGFQQSVYCGVPVIIDPIGGNGTFPGGGNNNTQTSTFPIWGFILIGLFGLILLLVLIWFLWYKFCRIQVDKTKTITGDRRKSYGTLEPVSNYRKHKKLIKTILKLNFVHCFLIFLSRRNN